MIPRLLQPKRLRAWFRRVQHRVTPGPLILMYHRIADPGLDPWGLAVSPARFAEQMALLRTLAPLAALTDVPVGWHQKRSLIVTFDDGYADNWNAAVPILERFDIPATIFVTTEAVGSTRAFWWDELAQILLEPATLPEELSILIDETEHRWQLGHARFYGAAEQTTDRRRRPWEAQPSGRLALYYAVWGVLRRAAPAEQARVLDDLWNWSGRQAATAPYRLLTPPELTDLGGHRLITIGSHTLSHPLLPVWSAEEQRHEIVTSRQLLEHWLQRPVTTFSYPYGEWSATTAAVVRDAGYNCACTTAGRRATAADDLHALPRVEVLDWSGAEFAERVRSWLRS